MAPVPGLGFDGKVFAITGAGSGIGRALARTLRQRGALLSLADINGAALEVVKSELLELVGTRAADSILVTELDVRSQQACNEWIQRTDTHFSQPLAGAANLAGVIGPSITQQKGSIQNITDEEFDWVMDVNVKGTLNSLRAELPYMKTGDGGRGGGSIVNASSVSGIGGVEYNGPYVAAKHAVIGLTRTAAKEEGHRAIRLNAVAPGLITTPMMKKIEQSKGSAKLFGDIEPGALARRGDPEEVANAIAFLLGPESSFINGVVLPIEGGWYC